jgi:Ran-binding protein 1
MSENLQAFLASKKEEDEEGGEDVNPEEEVKGDWKAVDLPEVEVKTGEENKELIYKGRGKLYRWGEEQWKERGLGDVKLLRDKDDKKVSFVMRQDSTKKVIANFIIEDDPLCQLVPHAGSDKAWLWMAHDYSDGEPKRHKFALRFGTPDACQEFKRAFDDAKIYNHCIRAGTEATPAPVIEEKKTE